MNCFRPRGLKFTMVSVSSALMILRIDKQFELDLRIHDNGNDNPLFFEDRVFSWWKTRGNRDLGADPACLWLDEFKWKSTREKRDNKKIRIYGICSKLEHSSALSSISIVGSLRHLNQSDFDAESSVMWMNEFYVVFFNLLHLHFQANKVFVCESLKADSDVFFDDIN